ncbi:hypothetical protein BH11PSE11_BH11PSE11_17410 [soil metagenome]
MHIKAIIAMHVDGDISAAMSLAHSILLSLLLLLLPIGCLTSR